MPIVADDMTTSSFNVKDGKPEAVSAPKKVARRHSVDFKPDNDKVQEYDRVAEEDAENVWYNRDEYDIIKARNSLIVKMIRLGQFEEDVDHSSRGLEHKLRDGFKQRRANKFNALNAVLEEQDRQYNRGTNEPEKIAEAYSDVAGNAKETAFVNGLKDAEASLLFSGQAIFSSKHKGDGEDESVDATECETISSDASRVRNKSRLRNLFKGVSLKRKDAGVGSRRCSM